jgi:CRISPR-associated protein (TIGR02710 family)
MPEDRLSPIRGVLFTVGTTVDPIQHTLHQLRPEAVAFVCSEETVEEVGKIKASARAAGLQHEARHFTVPDPDALVSCVQHCQQALSWLLNAKKLESNSVRVDYTGGTKNLSAAAVLAAVPFGISFLYVTGRRRRDAGGRVLPGTEKLVPNANPWEVLGVEELRRALHLADLGQFSAARQSLDRLQSRLTGPAAKRMEMLVELLSGLSAWDAFDHATAQNIWKKGRLPADLASVAEHAGDSLVQAAAREIVDRLPALKQVVAAIPDAPKDRTDPVLADLIANADRRLAQGQSDLAAQLYYRALELNAGRRLRALHKLDNGQAPLDKLPEPLRTEAAAGCPDGKTAALGMDQSYRLLSLLDDPQGKKYTGEIEKWRQRAQTRNKSWLVHGLQNVSADEAGKLRSAVLAFLELDEKDLPAWPKLCTGG